GRKVQDRLLFRPGRLPWHRCPVVPDFWGDMHVTVRRSGRTRIVAALGLAALAFAVSAAGTAAPASAVQTAQNAIVSADPVGWTPHVLDGRVKAIVQAGNTIVLGGSFTQVSSADGETVYERRNLVAFDATTGEVNTTFAPD